MLAEANVAVIRTVYEAFSTGNLDALDEVVAADFVDHNPGPGQGPGLAGLKQIIAAYRAAFPDLTITLEDAVAAADKVATRAVGRGTQMGPFWGRPPTGKQAVAEVCEIARIAGGKVVERWGVIDMLGLLQQLGMVSAPGATPAGGALAHTVIRHYKGDPANVEEAIRRAREGFVPLISQSPGFLRYVIGDLGNGEAMTVSTFQTREQAQESVRLAAEWVRANLGTLLPNPPQVTEGAVRVREVNRSVEPTDGVLRRYTVDPADVEEIVRRAQSGFVPIVTMLPGFAAYSLLDCGGGTIISLSSFASKEASDQSTREAAQWVRENLADLIPNPPEVITGTIRIVAG